MKNNQNVFLLICVLFERLICGSCSDLCFPKDFRFGVATAAYQVEGAWNESGKGESTWDRFSHQYPERILGHTNGDMATDSYHLFREDVKLVKDLKAQFYRFSISWPRILPSGYPNKINKDGVRYYTDLLDELDRYNISALVTMYHWDLPQQLEDIGGWTNPLIVDYFSDYARILFELFGNRVKHWLTINEPWTFCEIGYDVGSLAPGVATSSGIRSYLCGHHVLLAHAAVYHMYQKKYKHQQKGKIGLAINSVWIEPASTSNKDKEAAETAIQFYFGWFAHPIFSKEGDYPRVMRQTIDEKSKLQNFTRSRLPKFTKEEVKTIRGSADFMGLNHYTTSMAKYGNGTVSEEPSYSNDMGVDLLKDPKWKTTNSTWLSDVPWGFRKTLNWIKKAYNNPRVVITENGVSYERGLEDPNRTEYIRDYLRSLQAAVTQDGCRVSGYTYWSLLDNFEWSNGYTQCFGLYKVDFSSPRRTRTPRHSAAYFRAVASTGCIPDSWPGLH